MQDHCPNHFPRLLETSLLPPGSGKRQGHQEFSRMHSQRSWPGHDHRNHHGHDSSVAKEGLVRMKGDCQWCVRFVPCLSHARSWNAYSMPHDNNGRMWLSNIEQELQQHAAEVPAAEVPLIVLSWSLGVLALFGWLSSWLITKPQVSACGRMPQRWRWHAIACWMGLLMDRRLAAPICPYNILKWSTVECEILPTFQPWIGCLSDFNSQKRQQDGLWRIIQEIDTKGLCWPSLIWLMESVALAKFPPWMTQDFPASHQLQHPNHLDQHRTDVEPKIRNFGWQSVKTYHFFKRFSVDLRKDVVTRTTLKFLSIQVYAFHSVSRSALWLAAEVLEPVSSIAAAIGNRRASPTTLPLARPAQTCLPIINHGTKEKSGDNNESTLKKCNKCNNNWDQAAISSTVCNFNFE